MRAMCVGLTKRSRLRQVNRTQSGYHERRRIASFVASICASLVATLTSVSVE